jgi:16S rRNA (guanine(1405)-N(7))-methyltransferase
MMDDTQEQALLEMVQANPKYRHISQNFIRRLCKQAIDKGLSGKSAVKAVRNKLHQVGRAYLKGDIPYQEMSDSLSQLPKEITSSEVKDMCIKMMRRHSSTSERVPILEDFYSTCLASIMPIHSVLDLACGLNPLAIPWMPLANNFVYHACDIFEDMLSFLDTFFQEFKVNGKAQSCDLFGGVPQKQTQVTFLLKSIPCLEQVDKTSTRVILEDIPSDHILISFPIHSLRGQKKGMQSYYQEHFYDLVSEKTWQIKEFIFQSELAFLVTK